MLQYGRQMITEPKRKHDLPYHACETNDAIGRQEASVTHGMPQCSSICKTRNTGQLNSSINIPLGLMEVVQMKSE